IHAGISSVRMSPHRDGTFNLLFQLGATESPDTEPVRFLDDPYGLADRFQRFGLSRILARPHLPALWRTRQGNGLHAHLFFSSLLLRRERRLYVPVHSSPYGGN